MCDYTLGLTELWRNKIDKHAFYAVPFPDNYNKNTHEFYSSTYNDVINNLEEIISTVREHNPQVKFLFSVSPVPLSLSFRGHLGPYIATQYSKSILHVAAHEIVEKHRDVYYMPSYEIARNDPLRYYTEDGRHVNSNCVNTIMEVFEKLYVSR